jgi:hypothetical protein
MLGEDEQTDPDPLPSWQPNVRAPEFIPTLSMACPVVNVLLQDAACVDGASVASPFKSGAFETPEKGIEAHWSGRSKKRRPPALQEPEKKRTKSEERQRPMPSPAGQHPIPEASEDVWQHRREIRQRAITLGKDTREYQWYSELKRPEDREEGEPVTPDPRDRTVSKRHWKYTVQQWRFRLKQQYLDDGPDSVVSTTEGCESPSVPSMQDPPEADAALENGTLSA